MHRLQVSISWRNIYKWPVHQRSTTIFFEPPKIRAVSQALIVVLHTLGSPHSPHNRILLRFASHSNWIASQTLLAKHSPASNFSTQLLHILTSLLGDQKRPVFSTSIHFQRIFSESWSSCQLLIESSNHQVRKIQNSFCDGSDWSSRSDPFAIASSSISKTPN